MHQNLSSLLAHDESLIALEMERFAGVSAQQCRSVAQDAISEISLAQNFELLLKGLLNAPGKRVRPLLACWMLRNSNAFFGAPSDTEQSLTFMRIAAAVEVLHTASLVIDDIEDGSRQRRGKPALHIEFGIPRALNLGSWLYFAALRYLQRPELLEIGCEVLFDCHVGQGLDIGHQRQSVVDAVFLANAQAREHYYMSCARLKTSRLMEFVSACGAKVLNIAPSEAEKIARAFTLYGTAFQILDDLRNFIPSLSGPKTFEDLSCGIRNFVCLELLNELSTAEGKEALECYNNNTFKTYVLAHPGLRSAVHRTLAHTEHILAEAQTSLATVCTSKFSEDYLHFILEKPLVELKNAIVDWSANPARMLS